MSKQVTRVDGEDVVMREDGAKANRGTRWALYSLMLFILAIGALFLVLFFVMGVNDADPNIRNATNTAAPAR